MKGSDKLTLGLQEKWGMVNTGGEDEEAACVIPKTVFEVITLPFIKCLNLNIQL